MNPSKVRIAVVGASGYTGGELLRLLVQHPRFEIAVVTSEKSAGSPVASVFPQLGSVLPLSFEAVSLDEITKRADAVFLALPHTKSFEPVATLLAAGKRIVDLSADYRLKDAAAYETWYQTVHPHPKLLQEAVYGLPELHRPKLHSARLVASPGCYPTAAILQLAPLVAQNLILEDCLAIDAKSGISGAGRSPALPYHFPEANEGMEAYNVGRHRHTPEIEQELNALLARGTGKASAKASGLPLKVAFTPHLVPLNRGILSTAYCRLREPMQPNDLVALYRDFYKGERFIRLLEGPASPNPRHVRGSNFCDLSVFGDSRTGWVITVAALDNLVKGAAGQAIQALNLMLGLPEETGLTSPGLFP
jgi:N-acetyl-gamma-glutamyl-phosphate reductase